MAYPAFFDTQPTLIVRDRLAGFLGAATDGLIEYTYTDVVKCAGHSCPTVAGAWLMTRRALQLLYPAPNEIPERGGIAVAFRDSATDGETGVTASVVGFLTGAAPETGFKGLRGQHVRRDLMQFAQPINGQIRFGRCDTGASVCVSYDRSIVPAEEGLFDQLYASLLPETSADIKQRFGQAWQDRVRRILENGDNPAMVVVS